MYFLFYYVFSFQYELQFNQQIPVVQPPTNGSLFKHDHGLDNYKSNKITQNFAFKYNRIYRKEKTMDW